MYTAGEMVLKSPVGNEYLSVDTEDVDWDFVQYVDDEAMRQVSRVKKESIKYVDQAIEEGLMRPVRLLPPAQQVTAEKILQVVLDNENDVSPFDPAEVVNTVSCAATQVKTVLERERDELKLAVATPRPERPVPSGDLENILRQKREILDTLAALLATRDAEGQVFRETLRQAKELREIAAQQLKANQLVAKELQPAAVNLVTQKARTLTRNQQRALKVEEQEREIAGLKEQVALLMGHDSNSPPIPST